MNDTNLDDDLVKLVSYSIVSIARDAERVLHTARILITDAKTREDFVNWVVAEYVGTPEAAELTPDDEKHLEVSFKVEGRWAEPSLRFEEKQLERLEAIRDAIAEGEASPPPADPTGFDAATFDGTDAFD